MFRFVRPLSTKVPPSPTRSRSVFRVEYDGPVGHLRGNDEPRVGDDLAAASLVAFAERAACVKAAERLGLPRELLALAAAQVGRQAASTPELSPDERRIASQAANIVGDHQQATQLARIIHFAQKNYSHAISEHRLLRELSDLRSPHLWYPAARSLSPPRVVTLHIGPTNSGKTYAALEALRSAPSGLYCSPLRLLAWEVYDKLRRAWSVPCSLLTGQERAFDRAASHLAATVEVADVNRPVQVGVIDEVQLIADPDRGWAWTRAVLGLPARELHLCGDPSAEPLIRRLLDKTGEQLKVRRYRRLQPLVVHETPLAEGLRSLRRGDCVVAFGKRQLYRLKHQVETATPLRVSVVYGTLPPTVRRREAELFNRSSGGTDVLVATDAIGMGLNLQIGRVVFSETSKFDGFSRRPLTDSEIRQIAGRAGRLGSLFPSGEVAYLREDDGCRVRRALAPQTSPPVIERAGLLPEPEKLELFARLRVNQSGALPLDRLLEQFQDMARTDVKKELYFTCSMSRIRSIAPLVTESGLDLRSQFLFCSVPVRTDAMLVPAAISRFARRIALGEPVELDITSAMIPVAQSLEDLQLIEGVLAVAELYIALSRRFSGASFVDAATARKIVSQCTQAMSEGLRHVGASGVGSTQRDRR